MAVKSFIVGLIQVAPELVVRYILEPNATAILFPSDDTPNADKYIVNNPLLGIGVHVIP